MFKLAIPVLHAASSEAAERFYCDQLGFTRAFAYSSAESSVDPCYLGFQRDDAWIHVSSFPGDAAPGGAVYLLVEEVDRLHDELAGRGVRITLEPTDQPWGNREVHVEDPDGNSLRFVTPATRG